MHHTESSDPADWVDRYGDALFRFAMRRVEDTDVAQDLVQETLVAGLQARDRFQGQSTERSWLAGILKHKIMDHYRAKSREYLYDDITSLEPVQDGDGEFDDRGHWKSMLTSPREWSDDPSRLVERKEFWQVLHQALLELPPRMARVFILREVDGLSTEEICRLVDVTPENLWVILHRARKQLRSRIEDRFGTEVGASVKPLMAAARVA